MTQNIKMTMHFKAKQVWKYYIMTKKCIVYAFDHTHPVTISNGGNSMS